MTRQMVRSPLACDMELSAYLANLLPWIHPIEGQPTENRLAELQVLLEALPLDIDYGTLGFLRNWKASSRELWLTGEGFFARYQMLQVNLVLRRLQRDLRIATRSGRIPGVGIDR
jgi:hypothetical protein